MHVTKTVIMVATVLGLVPGLGNAQHGGMESHFGFYGGLSVPRGDLDVADNGFSVGGFADALFTQHIAVGSDCDYHRVGLGIRDTDIFHVDTFHYGGHLKIISGYLSNTRIFVQGGPGFYAMKGTVFDAISLDWETAGGVRLGWGFISNFRTSGAVCVRVAYDRVFNEEGTSFFSISGGLLNRGM